MKVGCQQCGASYSVADEKVAGRRLKLRCKKCGEPMVIDGSGQGSDEESSIPFGPNVQVVNAPPSAVMGDVEWYVASDDAAQGPYTAEEVQSHYAAGLITADTLVFHDGMEGWVAAGEVPELHARPERRSSMPPPPPRARAPVSVPAELLDRSLPMGRDPFADSAPAISPRVAAAELHAPGAQRDGTVQFSLDDIRALSAVSAPSSIAPPAGVKVGYAAGDGSGLIDMRSLSEAGAAPDAFQPIGNIQASPLDTMAPFALPARAQNGVDFRTKVLAGVASFGFLLAGAIGVFAITRPPQPQAVVAPVPAESATLVAAGVATRAAQPTEAAREAVTADEQAVAEKPKAEATAEDRPAADSDDEQQPERTLAPDKGNKKRGVVRRPAVRSEAAAAREKAKPEGGSDIDDLLTRDPVKQEPPKDEKASAPATGGDDIDSLLLGAIDKKATPKPEPAAASALPKTPTRDQMLAALGKAKAKAGKCKGTGVATAAITLAGSGRVASVSVTGVEGGAKSCVENAVRSTPFPKFEQDTFAVKFPFKLGG